MKYSESNGPLERRPFKVKNAKSEFLCPLCRSERAMSYSHKLNAFQYIQISIISTISAYLLYPVMKWRSFFVFFLVWLSYEFVQKLLYKGQITCPYCGFDATWYKRNVKVAKQLVHEFWGDEAYKKSEKSEEEQPPL